MEVQMLNGDRCWEAIRARDASQDGRFFFGVLTTGVYCRPSCPARPPRRENARFYETAGQAGKDGLSACLRCRPLAAVGADPNADRVHELCRYMDAHVEEPSGLKDLARRVGLSPYHVQRSFKAIAGVTPRQYMEALRLRKLKTSLRDSKDVTEAVYEAGYGSSSCVYERADTRLGMTPNQYRQGDGE
jgi:AraC family transcriptional regulator of adaptative response/methylated-DNA-[protein]-cysteine methyltransferase